jgi:hypothetical protein
MSELLLYIASSETIIIQSSLQKALRTRIIIPVL